MLLPALVTTAFVGYLESSQKFGLQRGSLIRPVAAYTDSTREGEAQYAKTHSLSSDELMAKTGPVGHLHCGVEGGSASLVESNSVIVSAHHIICNGHAPPEQCTFTYRDASKQEHPVKIKSVAGLGGDCREQGGVGDWIVFELMAPALGVTPYKIEDDTPFKEPRHVNLLGYKAMDFCLKSDKGNCEKDEAQKSFVYPRFIDDCEIRYITDPDGSVPTEHASNCASGPGTSGGAIIDFFDNILLGVVIAGPENSREHKFEIRSGFPITKDFALEGKEWYTLDLAISGKLAATIKKAAQAVRNNQTLK